MEREKADEGALSLFGGPLPSPAVVRAGELLGKVRWHWLHADLGHFLGRRDPSGDDEIIAAIIEWETANPTKLSDCAGFASRKRDPRLGHIPEAQRKLFHERWKDRCPQCGEEA